jgi:drug/metabolite transporter (DMT)-like permease
VGVTFGLLAAFFWGITDFLAGMSARRIGVRRAVFVSLCFGLVVVGSVFLSMPAARSQAFAAPASGWAGALAAAVCTLFGSLTLSKGLSTGKAAIVAPIAMSYGAVTTILSVLSGERLGVAGILICIGGVPLTAITREAPVVRHAAQTSPVFFAILAALLYGVGFFVQGRYALPALGTTATLFVGYALGAASLALILTVSRGETWQAPPASAWPLLLAQSTASLAALGSFAIGASTGAVAVVTVLSTLSGGVTALLGLTLRAERLTVLQWTGVAAVIAGAVVLRL